MTKAENGIEIAVYTMIMPIWVSYRPTREYASNNGSSTICSGNTVPPKITTNQRNPRRSRSATIAKPAAAPTTTAMIGETIA